MYGRADFELLRKKASTNPPEPHHATSRTPPDRTHAPEDATEPASQPITDNATEPPRNHHPQPTPPTSTKSDEQPSVRVRVPPLDPFAEFGEQVAEARAGMRTAFRLVYFARAISAG